MEAALAIQISAVRELYDIAIEGVGAMKSVASVLLCVALVGCQPNLTAGGPKSGPTEPCLPGKTVCIASVDGIALIRAPTFWLLDLGDRTRFDVGKVIAAAKRCYGPHGCGRAMTRSELVALNAELAVKAVPRASVDGTPVVAHQLGANRTVLQIGPPSEGPADMALLRFDGLECDSGSEPDCGTTPHIPTRFPAFVIGPGDTGPLLNLGWRPVPPATLRIQLPLRMSLP
jgi:hypothetical protein